MKNSLKAPSHLRPDTQAWWQSVHLEYDLAEHHAMLLRLACEAWDRCQEAREILTADGIIAGGREAGVRPHPCIAIERKQARLRQTGSPIIPRCRNTARSWREDARRSNRVGGWKARNGQAA
jgi:phage terminase small subunit